MCGVICMCGVLGACVVCVWYCVHCVVCVWYCVHVQVVWGAVSMSVACLWSGMIGGRGGGCVLYEFSMGRLSNMLSIPASYNTTLAKEIMFYLSYMQHHYFPIL